MVGDVRSERGPGQVLGASRVLTPGKGHRGKGKVEGSSLAALVGNVDAITYEEDEERRSWRRTRSRM